MSILRYWCEWVKLGRKVKRQKMSGEGIRSTVRTRTARQRYTDKCFTRIRQWETKGRTEKERLQIKWHDLRKSPARLPVPNPQPFPPSSLDSQCWGSKFPRKSMASILSLPLHFFLSLSYSEEKNWWAARQFIHTESLDGFCTRSSSVRLQVVDHPHFHSIFPDYSLIISNVDTERSLVFVASLSPSL